MHKNVKLIFFGFLIWLIPFLVSFLIFNLRESSRPLFESIMSVILTLTTLTFTTLYLKTIDRGFLKEAVVAGVLWFAISLIMDLALFMPESPMQMTFSEYMMDIGVTYLIILFVPIFNGYLIQRRR